MSNSPIVFNRQRVKAHRNRSAAALADHDFLIAEVADRIADRLLDVKRAFPVALDLGCHAGQFAQCLTGRGGIETLVQCDLAERLVRQASGSRLVADEECLPFADHSFDLVVSGFSLHTVNDLPGTLAQIKRVLKPDGLFIGLLFGPSTLHELRKSLEVAEATVRGGVSPRVAPFVDVKDAGALLQRAGFALPVVDTEEVNVTYGDFFKLMKDLRGMGESNAVAASEKGCGQRGLFFQAAEYYHDKFSNDEGRLEASVELIYLTGWSPHESQQKPLKPGSGQVNLKDVLT